MKKGATTPGSLTDGRCRRVFGRPGRKLAAVRETVRYEEQTRNSMSLYRGTAAAINALGLTNIVSVSAGSRLITIDHTRRQRSSASRYLGGMRKAPGIPVSSVASFAPW